MRVRYAGGLAVVTVLYMLTAWIGFSLASDNANVTAVWPPAGLALAALLVLGLRAWPAVLAGAFLAHMAVSSQATPSLIIAAGNTASAAFGASLARRYARGRHAFERGADILRFVAYAALIAPVVAATVGTVALRAFAIVPPPGAGVVWLTRWLGDAAGVTLYGPLFLLWSVGQAPPRARRIERVGLTSALALVILAALAGPAPLLAEMPLGMMMLPLLLWSAFRFNTRTTSTLAVVTATIAAHRTVNDLGPFSLGAPPLALLTAQTFVAAFSVPMLAVAAEAIARARVEAKLRLLNESLERRVNERTEELTRVHDRLVEAQAVAHVGSWEWDVEADTIWWSEEMCRIFGRTAPPSGYEGFLALVHPDDRARTDRAVRESGRTGLPFSFDHRIITPAGELKVIHANGHVETDAAGRLVRMAGTGHDITERTLAEEPRVQLIREQAKLREAEETNRAKDAFLATLSHELRTPLNAALGWAHILRERSLDDARQRRAVEAIYRNLTVQSRLVEDILDASRIAREGLRLDRAAVDVTAVFEAAVEMIRPTADARQVAIVVNVNGSGDLAVVGDARRLQQVAWNLLDNAVKFAKTGGAVTVTLAGTPDGIECTVEDDGPGIAPEFLPHVFDRFRQADASVTREHGGLGLGLAIAHDIVSGHGGSIAAGNRPGGGAVFVMRLPREQPSSLDSAAGLVIREARHGT